MKKDGFGGTYLDIWLYAYVCEREREKREIQRGKRMREAVFIALS